MKRLLPPAKFIFLLSIIAALFAGTNGYAQTINYFGTSGALNGNVWSTNPGGPYTSALNTTGGGAILVFNNAGTVTGPSANMTTVTEMRFNAAMTWTAANTISNAGTGTPIITIDVAPGVTQTLPQVFTAATGITKNNTGTLIFTAATLCGGATTINGGTLRYGINNVFAAPAINVNGGTLDLVTFTEVVGAVTLTSGSIIGTTGDLTGTSYDFQSGTVSAILKGTGFNLTKSTSGTVILSGNNAFTSVPVLVNAGTLKLGAAGNGGSGPLGTTAGSTTVAAGATLDLNGFTLANTEPLSLNGTGVSGGGALTNTGGAASFGGLITLQSATTITATSSGTLTISGNMSGEFQLTLDGNGTGSYSGARSGTTVAASLLKSGTGTWTLNSSSSSYVGNTVISAGTLIAGNNVNNNVNSPFGKTNNVAIILGDAATTTNNSSPALLTGGAFTIGRTITIANQATSGTYSIGGNANATSTFSGVITINQPLSITQVATVSNTLNISTGGITTGNAGTKNVTIDNVGTVTISSIISNGTGSIAVVKTNTGTAILSAANTYTGTTTVTGGILRGNNTNIAPSTDCVFGNNASGLFLNGGTIQNNTAKGFSRPLSVIATNSGLDAYGAVRKISSNITTTVAGSYNLNLGGITATSAEGQTDTLSGIISNGTGTLGITTIGTSTIVLSGSNTYTGATTLTGGNLRLGAANRISNSSNLVFNGGNFCTATTSGGVGFADTLGTVDVEADDTLALGTGSHSIVFATSGGVSWGASGKLTITGWTGPFNGVGIGTAGRVFIGTSANLTAGQLAKIQFYDAANALFEPAVQLSTGEVVPTRAAPYSLSYTSPNVFASNTAITPLTPTVTRVVTSYSCTTLSAIGLSINTATGVISGTTSAASSPATTYTVTATNAGGSTTFGVVISVSNKRYSVVTTSGLWSSTSSWAATSGGASGASVPISSDSVFIENGDSISVTANASCAGLSFTGKYQALSVSNGVTLTVSGTVRLMAYPNVGVSQTTAANIAGAGTINAGALNVAILLDPSAFSAGTDSNKLYMNIATFNSTGDITLFNNDNGGGDSNIPHLFLNSPCSLSGKNMIFRMTGGGNGVAREAVFTAASGSTLNLSGGPNPFIINSDVALKNTGGISSVVFTLSNGSTVNYNGTTVQNIPFKLGNIGSGGTTDSVSINYYNLHTNNTSSSGAVLSAPITATNVTNYLKVQSGIFSNNNIHAITGAAALKVDIAYGGNFVMGGATFTNNNTSAGAISIAGNFQLNQGGFATGGAAAWVYNNTTSKLTFGYTTTQYTIGGSEVFWPATNSPAKLFVLSGTGVDFNGITRTIADTFFVAANIKRYCNLTFNGVVAINPGAVYDAGTTCVTGPFYGCTSTLKYNAGGTWTRGNEWRPGGTIGNLEIFNSTTVNGNIGNGITCNDLTIGSGSKLYMDNGGSVTSSLTVGRDLKVYGTLNLGAKSGGDLTVGRHFLINSLDSNSVFVHNNRNVYFTGSAYASSRISDGATASVPATVIPFYNLIIQKSDTGKVVLVQSNITATNKVQIDSGTLNAQSFSVLADSLTMTGGMLRMSKDGTVLPEMSKYAISGGKIVFYGSGTGAGAQTIRSGITYKDIACESSGDRILDSTAVINIAGTFTEGSNIYTVTGSSVNFNGSGAQTIPALKTAAASPNTYQYNILTASGGNTKTLSGSFSIADSLKVATSTNLQLSSYLITIKSDSVKTARVAAVDGAISYGTGKFIVERFIPKKRAWRLLTAPISTTQTISAAWQEGGQTTAITGLGSVSNPVPGYGVHITGGTANNGINGFDYGPTPNTSSIFSYSGTSWNVMPTPVNTVSVTSQPGWMLFVRGNRSTALSAGTGAAVSNTTLRTTGQINTGVKSRSSLPAGMSVIGNPYPCAINFESLSRTNVDNKYYLWDANIPGAFGVGGFVTFNYLSPGVYTKSINVTTYGGSSSIPED